MTTTAVISRIDRQQRRSQPQPYPQPYPQLRHSLPTHLIPKTHSTVRLMPCTMTSGHSSTRRCRSCCHRCQTLLHQTNHPPSQHTQQSDFRTRILHRDARSPLPI